MTWNAKTIQRQTEDCKCGDCADCTLARYREALEQARDALECDRIKGASFALRILNGALKAQDAGKKDD